MPWNVKIRAMRRKNVINCVPSQLRILISPVLYSCEILDIFICFCPFTYLDDYFFANGMKSAGSTHWTEAQNDNWHFWVLTLRHFSSILDIFIDICQFTYLDDYFLFERSSYMFSHPRSLSYQALIVVEALAKLLAGRVDALQPSLAVRVHLYVGSKHNSQLAMQCNKISQSAFIKIMEEVVALIFGFK